MGPIAKKVLAHLSKAGSQKVVDLGVLRAARVNAAALHETVASAKELAAYPPEHAVYLYVMNQVSVLFELLTELDALDPISDLVGPAQEEYMPGWPPMSPISTSYFTTWAFFDAAVGIKRETIATILGDLAPQLSLSEEFIQILGNLQQSRLGVYVHEGGVREHIVLREIHTGLRKQVLACNAHWGSPGEIWLARLLAPPHPRSDEHVSVMSPYLVVRPVESEWKAFFERNLPKVVGAADTSQAFERLMKFGLRPRYWMEYVFTGYSGHDGNSISLFGLPDVPESLPHSRKFDPAFRFPSEVGLPMR